VSGVLANVSVTPTLSGSGLDFIVTDSISGKTGTHTSHEPNSYRDFTPPHGGPVGGPMPSRPTFIHNSGGLRLLFPCGKSRCFSVTDQSNALLLRSYGNAISDAHNRSEAEMANGKAPLQFRCLLP